MSPRTKPRSAEPPELPEMSRRLSFGAGQITGVALIALIPLLAAFNVFGEARSTAVGHGASLSISVDFPSRARHGALQAFTTLVTNRGPVPLDSVTVRFDPGYVGNFSEPQFIPSAERAYEVELTGMAPGEVRRVQGGLRASRYGRHRGRVEAVHSSDTVDVMIGTIVFP